MANEIAISIALVVGCLIQCSEVSAGGSSEKERLVRDLTVNYVATVEPDNATLNFGLSFVCSTYDQESHVMVTNVWESMTWTDKRLSWKPEDYNGTKIIRLPTHLVWLPDMKLYNSFTPTVERDSTKVVVSSSGHMIWVSPTTYRTLCAENEDGSEINCQFKIGSWTYDGDALKLKEATVDESTYLLNCPLALDSVNATVKTTRYACCEEPYSHAEITATFKPRN